MELLLAALAGILLTITLGLLFKHTYDRGKSRADYDVRFEALEELKIKDVVVFDEQAGCWRWADNGQTVQFARFIRTNY